jgi:hypothetical protein
MAPTDTYQQGSVMTAGLSWQAPHGGWHSFRICPDDALNARFTDPSYTPTDSDYFEMEECLLANPVYPTTNSTSEWMWLGSNGTPRSVELQLPQGLTCDHCIFSWRWDAWMSANEIYNQCGDIRIV